jgi:hypothetical protein
MVQVFQIKNAMEGTYKSSKARHRRFGHFPMISIIIVINIQYYAH